MGRHRNGDNLGSDLSHITRKSCLQQGENGRAGSDPSPSLCLGRRFIAIEPMPQTVSAGRQSLSLIFYFYFQCVPEDEQNVQITLCDHKVIYKSCFWDTHASEGFLWCCLAHHRCVLSGLSKSQPSARASVAHSLLHLTSKSSREYVQRWKMPLPHRYYHITCLVFIRFSRHTLSWPKVLAASF